MNSKQIATRSALQRFPVLAAHQAGQTPPSNEIFYPPSHANALDPARTLVVGNRGVGKSFWASALADNNARSSIAKAYGFKSRYLSRLDVKFGFLGAEGAEGVVSREMLANLPVHVRPDTIWRAIILPHLADIANIIVPKNLANRVRYCASKPEDVKGIFVSANKLLNSQQRSTLFIFDQLEQLAHGWDETQRLTKGLLELALALKSYSAIKTKIFMRPDQAQSQVLFGFPDASKLYGERVSLRWQPFDLYGLLFQKLLMDQDAASAISHFFRNQFDGNDNQDPKQLLARLLTDSVSQQTIFERFAGRTMGAGPKRGRTYPWVTNHLADARGETSPRTFIKALKSAAEHTPEPRNTAIDHRGIEQGVREASELRLIELEEDYPWVSRALEPLRRMQVPAEPRELIQRWQEANTVNIILESFEGVEAPLELQLPSKSSVPGERERGLILALNEISVIEVRRNGKIDVPDIFRLKAGIMRKGGVAISKVHN